MGFPSTAPPPSSRAVRFGVCSTAEYGQVVSDIAGKTGTLILDRITRWRSNPEELVKLAQGSLKNKKAELKHPGVS
jgi:hypothetical protein